MAGVIPDVALNALLAYFVRGRRFGVRSMLRILSVTVPATLGGTALTLWAMYALSAPTALASKALRRYLESGELPKLPVGYTDRAGRLMADVRYAVEHLDSSIRSLEGLSGTDHLTGLPNRREGEGRLANDIARTRRGGGRLTVAVVDLDGFKSVNDRYGHAAGDELLRRMARRLLASTRRADTTARYGGDEFVIVLPDTGIELAGAVAERIRGKISKYEFTGGKRLQLSLTASFGVATFPYHASSPQQLIACADTAMYEAKAANKNCVRFAAAVGFRVVVADPRLEQVAEQEERVRAQVARRQ